MSTVVVAPMRRQSSVTMQPRPHLSRTPLPCPEPARVLDVRRYADVSLVPVAAAVWLHVLAVMTGSW